MGGTRADPDPPGPWTLRFSLSHSGDSNMVKKKDVKVGFIEHMGNEMDSDRLILCLLALLLSILCPVLSYTAYDIPTKLQTRNMEASAIAISTID